MVNDMGIGAASSRTPAETTVRRHARGGEGLALPVLEANRPSRAALAADSDARRALYSELTETGNSTESARCGTEHTQ